MLKAHFELAEQGEKIWESLEEKYKADLYILFPHINEEYNYYALLHLEQFIQTKKAEKVVLLIVDDVIAKAVPLFTNKPLIIHKMQMEEKKAFLKYYALYEFSTRLTIISLKEPYDTCGENLLGVKGVTKEELLCLDIYRFNETPKKKRPIYEGKDEEIKKFLLTH